MISRCHSEDNGVILRSSVDKTMCYISLGLLTGVGSDPLNAVLSYANWARARTWMTLIEGRDHKKARIWEEERSGISQVLRIAGPFRSAFGLYII